MGRQDELAVSTIEQRGAKSGFELLHARADVGLDAVQSCGGLRDAAFIRDRLEDLQLGQVHSSHFKKRYIMTFHFSRSKAFSSL